MTFEQLVETVRNWQRTMPRERARSATEELAGRTTIGSKVFVAVTGVRELHRELMDKKYRYNRPGLQEQEWGMIELTVNDPFGNRITFGEATKPA